MAPPRVHAGDVQRSGRAAAEGGRYNQDHVTAGRFADGSRVVQRQSVRHQYIVSRKKQVCDFLYLKNNWPYVLIAAGVLTFYNRLHDFQRTSMTSLTPSV